MLPWKHRLRYNPQSIIDAGFTMIELLCVMVIVSSLGATAVGQFLDFRAEGRKAAVQYMLNSIRTGISNQLLNMKLRCRSGNYDPSVLMVGQLTLNDVTASTYGGGGMGVNCSPDEIPNPADRKFIDADALPANPYNGLNTVGYVYPNDAYFTAAPNTVGCRSEITTVDSGWCWDQVNRRFFINSTVDNVHLL